MKIKFIILFLLCSFSFLAQTNYKKMTDTIFAVNDVILVRRHIQFTVCTAYSQDVIDDSSHVVLDELKAFLDKNEELVIEIGIYTDTRGNLESNYVLTQNRADAIRKLLIEKGTDSSRISCCGYGETSHRTVYLSEGQYSAGLRSTANYELIELTDAYIKQFKQTNPEVHNKLHQYNRRFEIRITEIKPSN